MAAAPLAPAGAVSHLDLLAAARDLRRAAVHDDVDALLERTHAFREAFLQHTRAERHTFCHLPQVTQLVVARGQRQLLDLLNELPRMSGGDSLRRARVADLIRRLARQARLESRLLSSQPTIGQPGPGLDGFGTLDPSPTDGGDGEWQT